MKNKNKIFTSLAVLGSAIFAMVLTAGSGIFETFGLFGKNKGTNSGSYYFNLSNDNKNDYTGGSSQTMVSETDGVVSFKFSNCNTSPDNFAVINEGGSISNFERITSIQSIYPDFICSEGGELQFRASFDKKTWGEYATLVSNQAFSLPSNPYFLEFKAKNGSVTLKSLSISFSCQINPDAEIPESHSEFKKVTGILDDFNGQYLIVYEPGNVAFDGSLSTLDANNNTVPITISGNGDEKTIAYSDTLANSTFTITKQVSRSVDGTFSIKSHSGMYIGGGSKTIKTSSTDDFSNQLTIYEDNDVDIISSGYTLRFNNNGDQSRFRFYDYSGGYPTLYRLEGSQSTIGIPLYEVALNPIDAKNSYLINEKFSDFVGNGGLDVSILMSDDSSKALLSNQYTYSIIDEFGSNISANAPFPHAGQYTVTVSYGSMIPASYNINVVDVVTSLNVFKTKVSYNLGDAINLSDVSASKTNFSGGTGSLISYTDFANNDLGITLKNPSGSVVSSGTFNVSGYWTIRVYLLSNPDIYSEIQIEVAVVPVSSITLDQSLASLKIGKTLTLTPTILPENATDKTITWTTSSSTIATVSDGVVTGRAEGSVTISAKAGNQTATCLVTVSPIEVTGISFASSSIELDVGDSTTLLPTIAPSDATDKTVTWSILSGSDCITLSNIGEVSAVKDGTAVVQVSTNDGGFTASCTIVAKNVAVSNLSLNHSSLTMYLGGGQTSIIATVGPENATDKTVSWSIDHSNVATISASTGSTIKVNAVASGNATLTATAGNKTATCSITVSDSAPEWTLVTSNNDLVVGNKYVIAAAGYAYAMSTNQKENNRGQFAITKDGNKITWTDGDTETVQEFTLETGLIANTYAFSTGSGYIYAAGSGKNKNYLRTEETLSNNSSWEISANDGAVSMIAQGSNTNNVLRYNKTYSLFSCYGSASQEDIVLYTQTVGGGTTDVKITSISISPSSATLDIGDNKALSASVEPSAATNKSVSWSIDDTNVATISPSGVVTAVGAGTCTVTATAKDGSGVTGQATITVKKPTATLLSIFVENEKTEYKVGESFVKPTVTAVYSDETTANVSTLASFFGFNSYSAGERTITVSFTDNGVTKDCSYTITVTSSSVVPTGDEYQITFRSNGSDNSTNLTSATIGGEITTGNSYILSYNSMDKVYSGSDGLKMGSSKGGGYLDFNLSSAISQNDAVSIKLDVEKYANDVATVNAYVNGGSTAIVSLEPQSTTSATGVFSNSTQIQSLRIESSKRAYIKGITISTKPLVPVDPTAIAIDPHSLTMTKGENAKLSINYTPSNANQNKGITWTSGNTNIVTVSNDGTVVAKANGTTTITATGYQAGITDTINVVVKDIEVSGISVSPTTAEVSIGSTKQLTATISPYNATNQGVSWSSSDTSVATVDTTGNVTAKAAGTARITATAQGNTSKTATSVITVTEKKQDAWTIMIYMCGADLESRSGLASGDIDEILAVGSQPSDVNIVIQTGGASTWKKHGISSSSNQRYHVSNKKLVCDNSQVYNKYKSMGQSATLADFVTWGLSEYPAEKTGVVLWNHGGAMRGVCYDEKSNDDALLNSEVKSAISTAFSNTNRSEKLEFIGYDACLMQAQDIAEFNSQYFNYMIASQESEAGYGWDYDKWVDNLYAKNSTETILKEIVDTFIRDNGGAYSSDGDQTLSYLNLAYMSEYKTAFENFAQALSNKLGDKVNKDTFYRFMHDNVKYFGGEDDDDEYFGMFDVIDFLDEIQANNSYNPGGTYISDVKTAFNKVVKYSVAQSGAGNANGLCCIYSKTSGNWLLGSCYGTSETNFTKWRSFVSKYGAI